MVGVTEFPSRGFVVRPPVRKLSLAERARAANDLVLIAEEPLRLNGEAGSGFKIIARASVTGMLHQLPRIEVRRWLVAMLNEVENPAPTPTDGGAAA